MALNNGKHIVKEIDGTSCTIIEDNASKSRLEFLQSLLTFNKFEVKFAQNPAQTEDDIETYTIGVTDLIFNPVIAVYAKKLYTNQGHVVTPNYWNQIVQEANLPYWAVGTKVVEFYKEKEVEVEEED